MLCQRWIFLKTISGILTVAASGAWGADVPGTARQYDSHSRQAAAQAKLRPLGSPSLVDSLRQIPVPSGSGFRDSAPRPSQSLSPVQQTAWMQASGGMAIPPSLPPDGSLPGPPNSSPLPAAPGAGPAVRPPPNFSTPPSMQPGSGPVLGPPPVIGAPPAYPSGASTPLPPATPQPVPLDTSSASDRSLPMRSGADLAPMPPPQLAQGMATVGNCAAVSAPSGYSAGMNWGCGSAYPTSTYVPTAGTYVPPPATYGPTVISPAAMPLVPQKKAGCNPLFTLGQDMNNVQVGQGIIGQPKAYVPGQGVRNFIRYFTP